MVYANEHFSNNGRFCRLMVTKIVPDAAYFCNNKNKKAMKEKTNSLKELYTDEAVCFIADRHDVTSQQLLEHFRAGELSAGTMISGGMSILLEPNEIEILKGLSQAVGYSDELDEVSL